MLKRCLNYPSEVVCHVEASLVEASLVRGFERDWWGAILCWGFPSEQRRRSVVFRSDVNYFEGSRSAEGLKHQHLVWQMAAATKVRVAERD